MAGILKVDKYQDFNGNDIMTSDGAGNITMPNGIISGQNYPAFGAEGTSDQALSTDTFTQLTFPTEEFDIGGCYASNTFTVPTGKAGKYFFSVQAEAPNNNNTFQIYWVKNGTRNAQHRVGTKLQNSTDDPGLCMTALFDLSDGDTVSVDGYLSTAGNLRYKWFQGFRIGT